MQGRASTLNPSAPGRSPSFPSGTDPHPPSSERGGGGSGWVELSRTQNDIEAHLLAGRLHEAGIETRRLKDRSAPGAWLHGGSNPWAPVAILVKKWQLEAARLVLAEISWAQPSVDPLEVRSRVQYSQRPARSFAVAWWVGAIALGLLFTSIALARTGEVLRSCELPLVCASGEAGEGPGD